MAKAFSGLGATICDATADLPSSPVEGLIVFQKDTNELKIYDGAAWIVVSRTDAAFFDSSGRLATPLRPSFKAYLNTSGNPGTSSPLVYTQTRFNIGSCYSTSTGRFTAPIAGVYYFSACANIYGVSGATGSLTLRRYNSSNVLQDSIQGNFFVSSGTGDVNRVASGCIYMDVNDYMRVEMSVYGTMSGGADWNQFMGFFVG